MKLYVLFAQRTCRYAGQYGVEALKCMTEYEYDENSHYLIDAKKEYQGKDDFESIEIVELDVDEKAVHAVLSPAAKPIPAKVVPNDPA